jgi:hypothetical protein
MESSPTARLDEQYGYRTSPQGLAHRSGGTSWPKGQSPEGYPGPILRVICYAGCSFTISMFMSPLVRGSTSPLGGKHGGVGSVSLLRNLVPQMNEGASVLFITSSSVRQPIENLDTSNVLCPGSRRSLSALRTS